MCHSCVVPVHDSYDIPTSFLGSKNHLLLLVSEVAVQPPLLPCSLLLFEAVYLNSNGQQKVEKWNYSKKLVTWSDALIFSLRSSKMQLQNSQKWRCFVTVVLGNCSPLFPSAINLIWDPHYVQNIDILGLLNLVSGGVTIFRQAQLSCSLCRISCLSVRKNCSCNWFGFLMYLLSKQTPLSTLILEVVENSCVYIPFWASGWCFIVKISV